MVPEKQQPTDDLEKQIDEVEKMSLEEVMTELEQHQDPTELKIFQAMTTSKVLQLLDESEALPEDEESEEQ